MDLQKIEEVLYIPDEHSSTPVKKAEALFIHDFLKEKKIFSTLEVGLGYGRSASYIMAATGKPHIAIDPFQNTYRNGALQNIEKAGLSALFTHINDFSHFALPEMCKKGMKFDFIFIDGDHKFDGILLDFYYAAMLCNKNGYILFHDTWMRSTRLVTSFIENNRNDFSTLTTPLQNFHLMQKTGVDERNGMYFREFYTRAGILKYSVIRYIDEHPDSGAVKFYRKLKR